MKWLGKFFQKLWKLIKKILAVVLVIAAIVIAVWALLITGGAALPLLFGLSSTMMFVVAGLSLVGAFLIDKETAGKVVGDVGDAIGDAAGAVGDAAGGIAGGIIGGVTGGLLGSLVENPWFLVGAIALGFYLLSGDDEKPTTEDGRPQSKSTRADRSELNKPSPRASVRTEPQRVSPSRRATQDMESLLNA